MITIRHKIMLHDIARAPACRKANDCISFGILSVFQRLLLPRYSIVFESPFVFLVSLSINWYRLGIFLNREH